MKLGEVAGCSLTRPCKCGLASRPRRLFGFSTEPVDGAPCFCTGSIPLGGSGLPSTDSLSGFVPAKRLLGDKAYDSAALRQSLSKRGTRPVIPNRSNRKRPFNFSKKWYRERHRVENAFCRLKDFRRIATRYDRLARNLAPVYLAATVIWWI